MSKKILSLILMLTFAIMTGCSAKEQSLNNNISTLTAEVSKLEDERDRLNSEIYDTRIDNGLGRYVITFCVKQTHFTLNLGEHLKDAMNEISIEIPVDKEYYDSVEVGDVIDNSFRVGSLVLRSSFGNWQITVAAKEIR